MKKIVLTIFFLLVITLPINVQALIIDNNNLTIEKGNSNTISLSTNTEVEISSLQFTLVYTSYDVPAYFKLEDGLTETNPNGIVHKIKFSEPVSGDIKLGTIKINVVNNPKVNASSINIHSAKAVTVNGDTINLTGQTINVTVGTNVETVPAEEKEKEQVKNLLEKIESKIVKIELIKDTYEYKVNVKEDITELDLKPIVKDEKYKVEISSQKIDELKDGQIIITVSDGEYKEEYKINVSKIEVEEIEIDEETFESNYDYKGKWIIVTIIMSVALIVGLCMIKKK